MDCTVNHQGLKIRRACCVKYVFRGECCTKGSLRLIFREIWGNLEELQELAGVLSKQLFYQVQEGEELAIRAELLFWLSVLLL